MYPEYVVRGARVVDPLVNGLQFALHCARENLCARKGIQQNWAHEIQGLLAGWLTTSVHGTDAKLVMPITYLVDLIIDLMGDQCILNSYTSEEQAFQVFEILCEF